MTLLKSSSCLLFVALAGALSMIGCGSDGGGDTDPGSVCGGCDTAQAREDCENDLLICDTFSDPGAREACIDDARC